MFPFDPPEGNIGKKKVKLKEKTKFKLTPSHFLHYTSATSNFYRQYHFTLRLNNLTLTTFVQLDFKVLHLLKLKSLQEYYCTLHVHNLTFTTFVQLEFTVLHLHNLKSLSTISLYTTLAQPEFQYILTT